MLNNECHDCNTKEYSQIVDHFYWITFRRLFMKLRFLIYVNDYIIYIYISENQLVYKGLLDKFDKEDLYI